MIKKKGQIVPKSVLRSNEKKAQHLLTFGCDVEISGDRVTAISDGPVIVISANSHVLKKKRQRTVKGFRLLKAIYPFCSFEQDGNKTKNYSGSGGLWF